MTNVATLPKAGRPIRRDGKPYVWATWLAKLLGADAQCQWQFWFKAHYKHKKFQTDAQNLIEWNADHTDLMTEIRAELEAHGWICAVEDDNAFKIDGKTAVVAGKPDLVATMPGHVLVVDGKTGKQREADVWQVLLYLYARVLATKDATAKVVGEVRYRSGTSTVTPALLTTDRTDAIARTIHLLADSHAPKRSPSRYECAKCDIGFEDCPDRYREQPPIATEAF